MKRALLPIALFALLTYCLPLVSLLVPVLADGGAGQSAPAAEEAGGGEGRSPAAQFLAPAASGQEEQQPAGSAADSEVIRLCDPKVPFRTGVLKHSPMIASVIGQGLVIYATPYARYLYYGEVYGPNIPIFEAGELAGFWSPPGQKKHPTGRKLTYSGAPERGAFWFERMKAEHGDEIIRGAAARAGGRATP